MTISNVAGCRVLVVEDETMIVLQIEGVLEAMDFRIVGPAGTIETALQLAAHENFDLTILDVTIRGGKVYPVAELLLSRGIPLLLASGYGDRALPETLRNQRCLMKPFTPVALEDQVRQLCSQAAEMKRQGDAVHNI
jgi:DNA-binding NtrC family response regulator